MTTLGQTLKAAIDTGTPNPLARARRRRRGPDRAGIGLAAGTLTGSAEIGNAISNEGDPLFPAIAKAPKAAALANLYTTAPALILGYGAYALGWRPSACGADGESPATQGRAAKFSRGKRLRLKMRKGEARLSLSVCLRMGFGSEPGKSRRMRACRP